MSHADETSWEQCVSALLEREHARQERRGDHSLSMNALSTLIDASRADDAPPATRARAAHAIYEHRLEDADLDGRGDPLPSSRDATRARAARTLARFILHANLSLRACLALQLDLLSDLDSDPEPTLLALANLWARAPWAARRALLARAATRPDPRLLPAYARCFSTLDLSSKLIVTQTCADLDDLTAEPILRAALAQGDLTLSTHAVRALARVGTPACLPDLHAARSAHPSALLADLDAATELILTRHPVRSSSGDLSLVEDDLHGALSSLDVPEGQLSLYRDVHAASSAGLPDPEDTSLTSPSNSSIDRAGQWEALPLAPRPVSPLIPLALAVLGESPTRVLLLAAAYPAILALGASGPLTTALSIAAGIAPIALGARYHTRHVDLLREGTPGLALVTPDPLGSILLEFITPAGDVRARHVRQNALGTLGDERLEPVLFTPHDDVALDEMLHVTFADGALTLTHRARVRALLTLLAHVAICALLIGSRPM